MPWKKVGKKSEVICSRCKKTVKVNSTDIELVILWLQKHGWYTFAIYAWDVWGWWEDYCPKCKKIIL